MENGNEVREYASWGLKSAYEFAKSGIGLTLQQLGNLMETKVNLQWEEIEYRSVHQDQESLFYDSSKIMDKVGLAWSKKKTIEN